MQIITDKHDTALALTGALDTSTADEVLKALLIHLESYVGISLDLSQIDSCDAVGVQLLLAMQKSAEVAAKPFAVVAASNEFASICAALGLSSTQFVAATIPLLEPACPEMENTVG